ncbi:MAG TPA: hypothetical protein VMS31_14180 [Pyrinomonadaceae bacterium]|nr:hypothetical protein [Pyrinomonadaceae bacterium]
MKQSLSHRLHLDRRNKGDTAQLAAQLAPLEEQDKLAAAQQAKDSPSSITGGANQEIGAIVIDNSPVSLSADISEARRGKTFLGMEPVVVVILLGMLAFIVFIAWQISLMPVE